MLILAGIIGVFTALDLFLFYFFWELMLVPMYFLISIWGHENRTYAAIKFFIFTQASGLFMLLSILGLYFIHGRATGIYTFDYFELLGTNLSSKAAMWLMLGFIIAFAVKLPAVPVHTWLPDAHTQAPTAGSVILAGLLLKTGAYGFIRFVIPLFPASAAAITPAMMIIAVIGIIYGAILAFAQTDLKRLVAYTSISHLGFALLGIFAWNTLALQGAVIVLLAHGLSTGALFVLVGVLDERLHSRDMSQHGRAVDGNAADGRSRDVLCDGIAGPAGTCEFCRRISCAARHISSKSCPDDTCGDRICRFDNILALDSAAGISRRMQI